MTRVVKAYMYKWLSIVATISAEARHLFKPQPLARCINKYFLNRSKIASMAWAWFRRVSD